VLEYQRRELAIILIVILDRIKDHGMRGRSRRIATAAETPLIALRPVETLAIVHPSDHIDIQFQGLESASWPVAASPKPAQLQWPVSLRA